MKLEARMRRRSQTELLTEFIAFTPFAFAVLNEFIGISRMIRYLLDIACIFLLLIMITNNRNTNHVTKGFNIWVSTFFVYTLFLFIYNGQSVIYYLWGLRNNFRFYVFFFACTLFLKKENQKIYMRYFDNLFYLHLAVSLFQVFVLHIKRDNLGGIFGTQLGCNGYLNIFLIIMTGRFVLQYLNKETSLWQCLLRCALIILNAAFAELKFFFVEFVAVIVLAGVVTRFSWRKILIAIGAIVGLYIGIMVLVDIFPEFKDLMTVKSFYDIASSDKGYTYSGDMNRLTALTMSAEMFLRTNVQKLFGLGLGNCDFSDSFTFLATPFFKKYNMLHYSWLSTAFVFLETGIIGLVFFFGFFVLLFWKAHKCRTENATERKIVQLSEICAVMSILIGIYDSSLRTEAAYMLYFVLSMPFWGVREKDHYEY